MFYSMQIFLDSVVIFKSVTCCFLWPFLQQLWSMKFKKVWDFQLHRNLFSTIASLIRKVAGQHRSAFTCKIRSFQTDSLRCHLCPFSDSCVILGHQELFLKAHKIPPFYLRHDVLIIMSEDDEIAKRGKFPVDIWDLDIFTKTVLKSKTMASLFTAIYSIVRTVNKKR